MGAGCYYTHKCNGTVAYWIDIDIEDEDDSEFEIDQIYEDVSNIIESLGYAQHSQYEFYNGLMMVYLESTYHGDGIVIRLEPRWEDNTYNLAMANHHKMEHRIAKTLSNAGYTLRYATSGYTANTIKPGELK